MTPESEDYSSDATPGGEPAAEPVKTPWYKLERKPKPVKEPGVPAVKTPWYKYEKRSKAPANPAAATHKSSRIRPRSKPGCRPRILPFDRFKYIAVLLLAILGLMGSRYASSPLMTPQDAFAMVYNEYFILFLLLGLELVRQVHFLAAENIPAYWSAYLNLLRHFKKPWMRLRVSTRARLGRITFWIVVYLLAGVVLSPLVGGTILSAPLTGLGIVWANLTNVIQYMFLLVFGVLQFVAIFWFMSRGGVDYYLPDEVVTRFDQVWGQDHVVAQVREVVTFLEDPDEIEARGGYVPGGILLFGPPGTGKTLIAEAVAGETGLPYIFVDPGAFTNMFLGVGVLKVKALYRKLRKFSMRYGGVVVFFDEADVLGNRGGTPQQANAGAAYRNCGAHDPFLDHDLGLDASTFLPGLQNNMITTPMGGRGGDTSTLNALLAEMNGLKKPRGVTNKVRRILGMRPVPPPMFRILHIMATNMPDSLDSALLRPGRMDRKFQVGYPSREGRKRTFEGYLAKVEHTITPEQVDLLATNMPGATGALIKDIVNEALIQAMRDGNDAVSWRDILKAKDLKTNGIPDNFTYVDRERHATSVHEACHAVAAYYLYRDMMRIDTVTIEPRGPIGGFVSPMPTEDRKFEWKSGLESRICVSLASLAGEKFFFDDDSSVGVGSDLASATVIALAIEGKFGMGSTIAAYDTLIERLGRAQGSSESDPLQAALADKVEALLQHFMVRTNELIRLHADTILAVSHALEANKTLDGEDVTAVIERHAGPLVDGSIYADPNVMADLWEYHNQILDAHKRGIVSEFLVPFSDQKVDTLEDATISELPQGDSASEDA